jgi:hypothetical protein
MPYTGLMNIPELPSPLQPTAVHHFFTHAPALILGRENTPDLGSDYLLTLQNLLSAGMICPPPQ